MGADAITIFLVDDDPDMLLLLERMLRPEGYSLETFSSAEAFLSRPRCTGLACMVTDLAMPGMTGAALQEAMLAAGYKLPVIFLSAHGDVPVAVRTMLKGAIHFLTKPCVKSDLLEAIERAVSQCRKQTAYESEQADIRARFHSLTPREKQVCLEVGRGKANKVIAMDLGLAEKTVKVHRGRVMTKFRVTSAASLARLLERMADRIEQP